jgi:hypothetical protein
LGCSLRAGLIGGGSAPDFPPCVLTVGSIEGVGFVDCNLVVGSVEGLGLLGCSLHAGSIGQ